MAQPVNGSKPEILSVRTAARSRHFHIEAVELRFANGNVREFERVAASAQPGAVIIVPLLDSGELVLVREYAVGLERYELSLPMGLVQTQESALQAANRELQEETGYAAQTLVPLHTLALALSRKQVAGVDGHQGPDIVLLQGQVGNDPHTQTQADISLDDIRVLGRDGDIRAQ